MIRDRNKNNLRTIEALIVQKLKNNEPRPKLLVLIKKACKIVKTATYRHEKERKICNSKFHCCSRGINKFGEPPIQQNLPATLFAGTCMLLETLEIKL